MRWSRVKLVKEGFPTFKKNYPNVLRNFLYSRKVSNNYNRATFLNNESKDVVLNSVGRFVGFRDQL